MVVLVQLWWCGGVGAVVVASAVDKKYKYRMLSSSIGADGDEVGGWVDP